MLIYVVYGILALLALVIVFVGISLLLSRGNSADTAEKTPVTTAAVEPEVAGGFFANERGNTNLVVEKARLDGNPSSTNFFDERLTSRNSLPVRENADENKKDDDLTL